MATRAKLCIPLTLSGLSYDAADVDQVQLSACVLVRRIEADEFPVAAESRMRVATPLAGVDLRQVKMAQRNPTAGLHVTQVWMLVAVFVRVGVVQDTA